MTAVVYLALFLQMGVAGALGSEGTCGAAGCADDASVMLQHKIEQDSALTGDHQQIEARVEELEQEQRKLINSAFMQQFQSAQSSENNNCFKDFAAYENSMTFTIAIKLKGKKAVGDGKLEAVVGGKVQGCAAKGKLVPFGPFKGLFLYLIMVYGKGSNDKGPPSTGQPIIFKYTDASGAYMMFTDAKSSFVPDGIKGNALKPVEIETLPFAKFENTMTETAAVKINGELSTDGVLLSFLGDEVDGVQSLPTPVPPVPVFGDYAGKKLFLITIYGYGPSDAHEDSSGKPLTFKYLKPTGEMVDVAPDVAQKFASNSNLGKVEAPIIMTETPAAPPPCEPRPDVPQKVLDKFTLTNNWGKGWTCAILKQVNACRFVKDGKVCDTTCEFGCP